MTIWTRSACARAAGLVAGVALAAGCASAAPEVQLRHPAERTVKAYFARGVPPCTIFDDAGEPGGTVPEGAALSVQEAGEGTRQGLVHVVDAQGRAYWVPRPCLEERTTFVAPPGREDIPGRDPGTLR